MQPVPVELRKVNGENTMRMLSLYASASQCGSTQIAVSRPRSAGPPGGPPGRTTGSRGAWDGTDPVLP